MTTKVTKADLTAQLEWQRNKSSQLEKENQVLRQTIQQRIDTAMIDSRIKLANALGQMVHAQAEAIKFIIGKEVM